jgi:hypothetical protein
VAPLRALAVTLVLLAARTATAGDCVSGDAPVDSSWIGSEGVVVCYDRCWRLDYATRQWAVGNTPAPAPVTS